MSISFQFSARHLHCVASAELCGTELFTAHFSAFVQTNAQRVIAILGWVGTTHLVSHWTLLCSLTGASIFITWFRKLRIVKGLAWERINKHFLPFFVGILYTKCFSLTIIVRMVNEKLWLTLTNTMLTCRRGHLWTMQHTILLQSRMLHIKPSPWTELISAHLIP